MLRALLAVHTAHARPSQFSEGVCSGLGGLVPEPVPTERTPVSWTSSRAGCAGRMCPSAPSTRSQRASHSQARCSPAPPRPHGRSRCWNCTEPDCPCDLRQEKMYTQRTAVKRMLRRRLRGEEGLRGVPATSSPAIWGVLCTMCPPAWAYSGCLRRILTHVPPPSLKLSFKSKLCRKSAF
jgi:hypothetical protein